MIDFLEEITTNILSACRLH